MKTKSTIEINSHACDHCGQSIPYSPWHCIVCGKDCCGDCEKLGRLRLLGIKEGPRYYGLTGPSQGYELDWSIWACPGCEDKVTEGLDELKHILAGWKQSNTAWKDKWNKLVKELAPIVEKREREKD